MHFPDNWWRVSLSLSLSLSLSVCVCVWLSLCLSRFESTRLFETHGRCERSLQFVGLLFSLFIFLFWLIILNDTRNRLLRSENVFNLQSTRRIEFLRKLVPSFLISLPPPPPLPPFLFLSLSLSLCVSVSSCLVESVSLLGLCSRFDSRRGGVGGR